MTIHKRERVCARARVGGRKGDREWEKGRGGKEKEEIGKKHRERKKDRKRQREREREREKERERERQRETEREREGERHLYLHIKKERDKERKNARRESGGGEEGGCQDGREEWRGRENQWAEQGVQEGSWRHCVAYQCASIGLLQCGAVWCSVLQCVSGGGLEALRCISMRIHWVVAVCCSVLQCATVCCIVKRDGC